MVKTIVIVSTLLVSLTTLIAWATGANPFDWVKDLYLWLIDSLSFTTVFYGLVLLAVAGLVVAFFLGGRAVWEEGGSVWTKRIFYGVMVTSVIAAIVALFMWYIGPQGTEGLLKLLEYQRQQVAQPFAEVASDEVSNDGLASLHWRILLVLLAAGVVALITFSSGVNTFIKNVMWPLTALGAVVTVVWLAYQYLFAEETLAAPACSTGHWAATEILPGEYLVANADAGYSQQYQVTKGGPWHDMSLGEMRPEDKPAKITRFCGDNGPVTIRLSRRSH